MRLSQTCSRYPNQFPLLTQPLSMFP
jgi:hypothetical protein